MLWIICIINAWNVWVKGMDDQYSSDSDDGDGFYSSQNKDTCYRCQKRVYPVERVDVGVLFHRRCFRCRVCGLQLTLRTFRWQPDGQPSDVYCHGHLPKIVGIINKDSMGIQSALNAPKLGVHLNEQVGRNGIILYIWVSFFSITSTLSWTQMIFLKCLIFF